MENYKRSPLLPLPDNIVENLRKIHKMEPGRLEEAVQIIRDWLEKQHHILKKDFSKQYLEASLLSCKGSVEKAKKQIDRLATMKTLLPKFFRTTNLKTELKYILDLTMIVPLPIVTSDFYRVLNIKFTNKHFETDTFMQYFSLIIMLTEYLKAHDYINGLLIIYDLRDIDLTSVVTKMNPVELQQITSILVEGYGARMKSINLLTNSKTIDVLIKAVKPFLSEKIGKRLHVVPSIESLQEIIPKEILPIEYGGNEKSIYKLWDEWIDELSTPEHQEYLQVMNKAGTNETLRSSSKFNEEYLGMPGSFRHLSVD